MAWIMSATSRKTVADGHLRSMQAVLLVTHITFLIVVLREHANAGTDRALADMSAEIATAAGGSSALALISGLMLALLILATGRGRASSVAATEVAAARAPQPLFRHADGDSWSAHEGLVARLNHDLRTPLNAIMGFAELMKAETFGPLGNERYLAYVTHMQSCGHDLLRATECTLAMASVLANPAESRGDVIDLARTAEEACLVAAGYPGRDAPVTLSVDRGIEVRSNAQALQQCLIDLLRIVRDRSTAASRIEIAAARSHGRVDVSIRTTAVDQASLAPRTGCRHSATASVDELAIGTSRAVLGLYGVPVVEMRDLAGNWSITLTLEDAAQADFFTGRPQQGALSAAMASAASPRYSDGFGVALPGSASRPA